MTSTPRKRPRAAHFGAPTRPMSSFFIFMNQRRPILRLQHPSSSLTDISKMISQEWKTMDAETKKNYEKQAAELTQRYKEQIDTWKKTQNYMDYQRKLREWKAKQHGIDTIPKEKNSDDIIEEAVILIRTIDNLKSVSLIFGYLRMNAFDAYNIDIPPSIIEYIVLYRWFLPEWEREFEENRKKVAAANMRQTKLEMMEENRRLSEKKGFKELLKQIRKKEGERNRMENRKMVEAAQKRREKLEKMKAEEAVTRREKMRIRELLKQRRKEEERNRVDNMERKKREIEKQNEEVCDRFDIKKGTKPIMEKLDGLIVEMEEIEKWVDDERKEIEIEMQRENDIPSCLDWCFDNGDSDVVRLWLNDKVKLGQYVDLFLENGVDRISTVILLDKDSLKEMGVDKVGHQLLILNEIEKLKKMNESAF